MTAPNDPIHQGIAAYRAGNRKQAGDLFSQVTQSDPNNQIAWYWLAGCMDNDEDKRRCLERVVAINPESEAGKRAAQDLAKFQSVGQTVEHTEPSTGAVPVAAAAPLQPALPTPSAPPAVRQQLTPDIEQNFTVIERADSTSTSVEVLHYNSLSGSDSLEVARKLYYARQAGIRLKQIRITLRNGAITIEAGALHFMRGTITIDTSAGGIQGLAKKFATSKLTEESMFKPRYQGSGEVYLEPSFGHFIITQLTGEEVIVDKGLFYAAEASVDVSVAMQKNISSALFGGEGLFQTRLTGSGWCVLCSPVPAEEIMRVQLQNEKLSVDGNFAMLRKGNIDFRVERSVKTLFGSVRSGEGLLQTFSGTGEVWLAPTQSIYTRLQYQSLRDLAQSKGSSGS